MFDFELVRGNAESVLNDISQEVIIESLMEYYFEIRDPEYCDSSGDVWDDSFKQYLK
jgi:hypothetical protein